MAVGRVTNHLVAGPAFMLCLVALAVLSPSLAQKPPAGLVSGRQPRIIVVGAGFAGISAGRDLVDAGLKDVTVLEARDRPGGRLHTITSKAGTLDLGAMWIHDAVPTNPLMQLVTKTLKFPITGEVDWLFGGQIFTQEGQSVDITLMQETLLDLQTLNAATTKLKAQEAAAIKANNPALLPKDIPLSQPYSQFVASKKGVWKPIQYQMANAVMCIGVQNLLNGNLTRLSTTRYGDAKTLPGIDVYIKSGYQSITNKLMEGVKISYNTVVKSLSQTSQGVTLTTDKGKKFTADYVIVTFPLGVLKTGSISFSPPLPAAKQKAIKDMGMGILDKVVLIFKPEDVFWDKTMDFLAILPKDWSGRWTGWVSYVRVTGQPILVAINSYDTARSLEKMTDKAVVSEALGALGKAFRKKIPTPIETFVTRWGSDPFSRGSYSNFVVGNLRNITEAMAAPHGRIFFAGEATSERMSTTTGAHLSGKREAARIVKMLGSAKPVTAERGPGRAVTGK